MPSHPVDMNATSIAAGVALYLTIGILFEVFGPPGDFDFRTLLFWPFGLDIRVSYWFKMRRIERDGARRIKEAIAERDSKLRMVSLEWTGDRDEAIVTVDYDGIERWRGSRTVWYRCSDEDPGSDWMNAWLADRWQEARRNRS